MSQRLSIPFLIHDWLKPVRLSFAPGPQTPLLEAATNDLLAAFRALGHTVQEQPDSQTDLLLTTAPFLRPLNWREALLFTVRRRFGLSHTPAILTLLHARPAEWQQVLDRVAHALLKDPPDPADWSFEGLTPNAFETLLEQGRRGGPILSVERVLQAQSKCIRLLLFVGEELPEEAYVFDLVGAHPRLRLVEREAFYREIALRLATVIGTSEVTDHQVVGDPIPANLWRSLETPRQMREAARQFGKRGFFTPTVKIANLVAVPSVGKAVADQYSEGCFATWEPRLSGLIATITGSARPVDKDNITDDDLAVIVGVREDGRGAKVRQVEGHRNDPPSSEAVEMIWLDQPLPTISLSQNEHSWPVPVTRSKLHGHRSVAAYHPDFVEYIPMAAPFQHYPVSCATEAQAHGICQAFSQAVCLRNPQDARQVAFTILPGHGVVIVEKWHPAKAPFQLIWEYMDSGYLEIASAVPQGPLAYLPGPDGRHHLQDLMNP